MRNASDNGTLGRYCKLLCDIPQPEPAENIPKAGSTTPQAQTNVTASVSVISSSSIELPSKVDLQDRTADAKRKRTAGAGGIWLPLSSIAGMFVLLYVAKQFEINEEGSGRAMLGWVFGVGAFGVLLFINWGSSARDVGKNFSKMGKSVAIFLVCVLLLLAVWPAA